MQANVLQSPLQRRQAHRNVGSIIQQCPFDSPMLTISKSEISVELSFLSGICHNVRGGRIMIFLVGQICFFFFFSNKNIRRKFHSLPPGVQSHIYLGGGNLPRRADRQTPTHAHTHTQAPHTRKKVSCAACLRCDVSVPDENPCGIMYRWKSNRYHCAYRCGPTEDPSNQ